MLKARLVLSNSLNLKIKKFKRLIIKKDKNS